MAGKTMINEGYAVETMTEYLEYVEDDDLPVLRPHLESADMGAYRIEQRSDGALVVRGSRIEQFAKMTDFSSPGGVRRFKDVIKRIGLRKAINRELTLDTQEVYIGEIQIDKFL